ncbi:hypothetical protein [Streptomyces capitiformicae]|uniref:Uncharacterized protein n=1 Tax=Streptomyces capitiformicae TaxID=2014920 RepID=A0A919DP83_9ACTN|nr:hypothetical protein [Streptomyces capitiformicae]GHE68508.1 hypothetical protein GCM10017771_92250 [Streptomyces capitiformicae]
MNVVVSASVCCSWDAVRMIVENAVTAVSDPAAEPLSDAVDAFMKASGAEVE